MLRVPSVLIIIHFKIKFDLILSLFFQYIAPLMANFDTSNNQQAKIRYLDDGEKLVVEWKDVYLQVSNSNAGKL